MLTLHRKNIWITLALVYISTTVIEANTTAYINEFHYDNIETDSGEFIEIAHVGSILGFTIVLYNGASTSRAPYNTVTPAPSSTTTEDGISYTVFDYPSNGIQNGDPDGIALVAPDGTVVDFVSYEGSFSAASGVAVGRTSVDVLVAETASTAVGDSLQRDAATGKWKGPIPSTKGKANGPSAPVPAPVAAPVQVPSPVPINTPSAPTSSVTLIHEIQKTGSPIVTPYFVNVQAIVTSLFTKKDVLYGFWMQEEDSQVDSDDNTSEGIFVLCATKCPISLSVGSLVNVAGNAGQSFSTTQIDASAAVANSQVDILSIGNPLPIPVTLALPASTSTSSISTFQNVEGMIVTFPTTLAVSEFFQLARLGEIVLTESSVPYTYTQRNVPSVAGLLAADAVLATRRITLDDDNDDTNAAISDVGPDEPYFYPIPGGLSVQNKFRAGDTIIGLTGVLQHAFNFWRVRPIPQEFNYTFAPTNQEPLNPGSVGGTLRVASFNVLNFFTTLTTSTTGCGPTGGTACRGAHSASELARQTAKIVTALDKLNPDIVGLIELQNSASNTPIANLVAAINAIKGSGTYNFIPTGLIGTDAISVGLLYKPSVVQPTGNFALLDSSVDPLFIDTRNRPVLIQTFQEASTGESLTISVCHFKSKGSPCAGDLAILDGQGNCRNTRKNAAIALVKYLLTDPTSSGDPDHLILGDLNSYAQEDSMMILKGANFTDLGFAADFDDYSFLFGGQRGTLDYALAGESLLSQVTGVSVWNINSDEVPLFDFNDEILDTTELSFERESSANLLFSSNELRSSDHDPILVGIALKSSMSVPTATQTDAPTSAPTKTPTSAPTKTPTSAPTKTSTVAPTKAPTKAPTSTPKSAPTKTPISCVVLWNLFNSQTDSLVASLTNGTIVTNPPPCTRTNIEAVVPCGAVNNVVTIELYQSNALVLRRVERVAKYFLFGNRGANVFNGRIAPGTYSVRVQVNGVFTAPTTFTLLGGTCA